MNYLKIYTNLIEINKQKLRDKSGGKYYEEHHINPKCLGGNDNKTNLVLLTAREHFLAHWLLVKLYPNNKKLIYAFNAFCMNTNNGNRPVSMFYEYAKIRRSDILRNTTEWKLKISETMKKKIWVKKDRISKRVFEYELEKYLDNGYSKGRIIKSRKSHSKETRKKIAISHKGKKATKEHKEKISKSSIRRKWINDGKHSKFVKEDIAKEFLEQGWKYGRN